jgi:HSP20 family protein
MESEDKGQNYYRMERSYGSFSRTIALPSEVDADNVEAKFKKGVLTVTLPKVVEVNSRKRIPIER